jgi:hypothetical protein
MNQNTVITFSNRLQPYSTARYSTARASCMYTNNTGSGVILLIKSDHLWCVVIGSSARPKFEGQQLPPA